jgi:hypothetical protein
MSGDYIIFSPLSPTKLAELVETCQQRVDEWYLDHEERDDQWGEFFVGGEAPSPGDAASMVYDADGVVAPVDSPRTTEVLERLGQIKSAITIERPGNIDVDKMQVSILRFLLEGMGEGLVQLVDVIELSEVILEEVSQRDGAPGFGDADAHERHLLADALATGDPEPLAADGPVDPVFRAVFNLLAALQRDGSLDVEPHFDAERATESIIRALSKSGGRDVGGTVAKVLLKARGVEELYLDDDELAKRFEALDQAE